MRSKTPRTDEVEQTYLPSWEGKYNMMRQLASELEIELGKVMGDIPAEDDEED
jgi:hypothetical protein